MTTGRDDQNYRIKHRVTSIERLFRYVNVPPPMVGDPAPPSRENDLLSREWASWGQREQAVYSAMMRLKKQVLRA